MRWKWFQIVNWFPEWIGIGSAGPFPASPPFWRGSIYSWRFCLGFIEIRKWAELTRYGEPKLKIPDEIRSE
jgi:hypothetical protein